MKIIKKAYAKINLTLEVLDKRHDGYHNIRSIMQSVSIFDIVVINTTKGRDIKILCSDRGTPNDERNTCYKAAHAFFKHTNLTNPGIAITIIKKIPSQSGLGGASTDAACTLHILNQMFKTNLSNEDLCFIGSKVGADVPFCVVGGTMLAQGIGEKLTPCDHIPECYVVIVKPEIDIPTGRAYEILDSRFYKNYNFTNDALDALKNKDLNQLSSSLCNSFETAININEIKTIKRSLVELGALNSLMTGSGSAVYGIFNDKNAALNCANVFCRSYKKVFICKTL